MTTHHDTTFGKMVDEFEAAAVANSRTSQTVEEQDAKRARYERSRSALLVALNGGVTAEQIERMREILSRDIQPLRLPPDGTRNAVVLLTLVVLLLALFFRLRMVSP